MTRQAEIEGRQPSEFVEIKPTRIAATDAMLEVLQRSQAHGERAAELVAELRELIDAERQPASLHYLELSAAAPFQTLLKRLESPALSFGVYNPNGSPIRVSLSGGAATAAARALLVPANTLVVFPLAAYDLVVGVDTVEAPNAFAAGNLSAWVLRFPTVQPASAARLA